MVQHPTRVHTPQLRLSLFELGCWSTVYMQFYSYLAPG
jgi:hypothetical protein